VRTPDQTEIAFFWANDLDGTYKPPGHLFRLTQIVAKQRNLSVLENARLFALVAIAMADAAIVAWDAKYADNYINLWRPASGIQLADTDGNLVTREDRNWTPLSVNPATGASFTPPFPAYVSGHATFGAVHAGIMRHYFGTDNVSFELDTDDPSVPYTKRRFNSFSAAALENGRSRVYLGVHYQWDADHGYESGTKLADYIAANFLKPLY
jgi:membrane-associated phospholipid phosphatase